MLNSQRKGIAVIESLRGKGLHYRVENYTSGLSELIIRAYQPDQAHHVFRITFQTTLYIELPTFWEKGDFQLATPEKREQILDSFNPMLMKEQQDPFLLFTTTTNLGVEILILCHKVFVSQETLVS